MNDSDLADSVPAHNLPDEVGSSFDQEVSALTDLIEDFEKVKAMPDPNERFYPNNRAARRAAEKRNRATKKRDPRG